MGCDCASAEEFSSVTMSGHSEQRVCQGGFTDCHDEDGVPYPRSADDVRRPRDARPAAVRLRRPRLERGRGALRSDSQIGRVGRRRLLTNSLREYDFGPTGQPYRTLDELLEGRAAVELLTPLLHEARRRRSRNSAIESEILSLLDGFEATSGDDRLEPFMRLVDILWPETRAVPLRAAWISSVASRRDLIALLQDAVGWLPSLPGMEADRESDILNLESLFWLLGREFAEFERAGGYGPGRYQAHSGDYKGSGCFDYDLYDVPGENDETSCPADSDSPFLPPQGHSVDDYPCPSELDGFDTDCCYEMADSSVSGQVQDIALLLLNIEAEGVTANNGFFIATRDGGTDQQYALAHRLVTAAWIFLVDNIDLVRWSVCINRGWSPNYTDEGEYEDLWWCLRSYFDGSSLYEIEFYFGSDADADECVTDDGGVPVAENPHGIEMMRWCNSSDVQSTRLTLLQSSAAEDQACAVIDAASTILHEMVHQCGYALGDESGECYSSYVIASIFKWAALQRYPGALGASCNRSSAALDDAFGNDFTWLP